MPRDKRAPKTESEPNAVASEVSKEKAAPSSEELEELRKKAAKADEHWDRVLRLTADFENTKKRLEKRSQDLIRFANETLIRDLLPVADDLERAVASFSEEGEAAGIREGLMLVKDTFRKTLERNGVSAVNAKGQVFDPHQHEAVGEVETDQVDEGRVCEEIVKGYSLNGRLLRPSRVMVARCKSKD